MQNALPPALLFNTSLLMSDPDAVPHCINAACAHTAHRNSALCCLSTERISPSLSQQKSPQLREAIHDSSKHNCLPFNSRVPAFS